MGFLRLSAALMTVLSGALFGFRTTQKPASNSAIVPASKLEEDCYDWWARHEEVLKAKEAIKPEVVLIGDSITHFWGGEPRGPVTNGPQSWARLFGHRRVLNLGFGWDRTQNVLWRLDHGEFDGLAPAFVVLHIGTNNFSATPHARENTPAEIAEGIAAICDRVSRKSPKTRIVLMAVFPRGAAPSDPFRAKIAALNQLLAALAQERRLTFLDIGPQLLDAQGRIAADMMADGVHPTEKGYAIWAAALARVVGE